MTHVDWKWLTTNLRPLTEPQVKALLDKETAGLKRRSVIIRLHQRYCALRAKRERAKLMREIS